ncbi:MAG: ComEC/Rec2 family competence protein [Planctomycetota bacterium]|jgi:ComEC/Rec2-related protein
MKLSTPETKKLEFKRFPLILPLLGCIAGIFFDILFSYTYLIAAAALTSIFIYYSKRTKITLLLILAAVICSISAFYRSCNINKNISSARAYFSEHSRITAELIITDCPLPVELSINENKKFRYTALIKKVTRPEPITVKIPNNTGVCFYKKITKLKPGDIIKTDFIPYRNGPVSYPGAYSIDQHNARLGIAASGRIGPYKITGQEQGFRIKKFFFNIRSLLVRNTFKLMTEKNAEFTAAVLLGYRKGLSNEVKIYFRKTGTGHLLAISGLHVGLVAAVIWFSVLNISKSKRAAASTAVICSLLYLCISGGRPSAVRAAVMVIIYLGGFLFYRKSNLLNSLSCAALIILFHNPAALRDAGFLLSFSAVIFISRLSHELNVILNQKKENLSHIENMILNPNQTILVVKNFSAKCLELLFLSISALTGIWPLTAYYFKSLALSGLLLNIIAVPVLPVIIAAGIIIQPGSFFPQTLLKIFITLCEIPAGLLIKLCRIFSDREILFFTVNPPDITYIILYYLSFTCLFIRDYLGLKTKYAICIITASFIFIVLSMQPRQTDAGTVISILPAYDSECSVIKTNGRINLFGKIISRGTDAVSFLRSSKTPDIDNVYYFTTHEDSPSKPDRIISSYPELKDRAILYRQNENITEPPAEDFKYRIIRNQSGSLIAYILVIKDFNILITERYWLKSLHYYLTEKNIDIKCHLLLIKAKNDSPENRRYLYEIASKTKAKTVFYDSNTAENSIYCNRNKFGTIEIKLGRDKTAAIRAYNGNNWKEIDKFKYTADN